MQGCNPASTPCTGVEIPLDQPEESHGKVPLNVGERPLPSGQLLERRGAVGVDGLRARHLAERVVECRRRGVQLSKTTTITTTGRR